MVRRVLMIAYHYPPQQGSSGILRTLKFSRYLPRHGWEPIILTAHPRAYPQVDNVQNEGSAIPVHRAFALDAARHLSIRGRYLRLTALPDRWASWWLGAVPAGLRLIRQFRPDAIWSTYPIATAHMIGHTLHKTTGIPWIADFRDPMVDESYPPDPAMRRAFEKIERAAMMRCARAVFTTPGTRHDYAAKFPDLDAGKMHVIENGYDEEDFSTVESGGAAAPPGTRPFVLLHSGVIYPSERDPSSFFAALSSLRKQGKISGASFKVILRATGHDAFMKKHIERCDIADIVTLLPPIPYREALSEMLSADGLLVLQASNCNSQIPAKLYEYLRARRPILALTDEKGDTAATLKAAGIDTIAPLDSMEGISAGLLRFLDLAAKGRAPVAAMPQVLANSREARTAKLASLLGEMCD